MAQRAEDGGVGGRSEGRGVGTGASPTTASALPLQDGVTAFDLAMRYKHKAAIRELERAPDIAAQVCHYPRAATSSAALHPPLATPLFA